MAGIRVSSVSNTTMFQGTEPPGAAPGKRPGRERMGTACGRAQSGAGARRSKRTKPQDRRSDGLRKNEIGKARINFFPGFLLQLLRRLHRRWRIRPAIAQAG